MFRCPLLNHMVDFHFNLPGSYLLLCTVMGIKQLQAALLLAVPPPSPVCPRFIYQGTPPLRCTQKPFQNDAACSNKIFMWIQLIFAYNINYYNGVTFGERPGKCPGNMKLVLSTFDMMLLRKLYLLLLSPLLRQTEPDPESITSSLYSTYITPTMDLGHRVPRGPCF